MKYWQKTVDQDELSDQDLLFLHQNIKDLHENKIKVKSQSDLSSTILFGDKSLYFISIIAII